MARFPFVYFFTGNLRSTSNPHIKQFLEKTKTMLQLKNQTDGAVTQDDGDHPELGLEANMVDALAMTQHIKHMIYDAKVNFSSKFRTLNELTYRNNFNILKYQVLQKANHAVRALQLQTYEYVFSTLYQSGGSITDTFSDILMAQAFHSNHGRDYIEVYSQLLGIPCAPRKQRNPCNQKDAVRSRKQVPAPTPPTNSLCSSSMTGLVITDDLLDSMAEHASNIE